MTISITGCSLAADAVVEEEVGVRAVEAGELRSLRHPHFRRLPIRRFRVMVTALEANQMAGQTVRESGRGNCLLRLGCRGNRHRQQR